MKSSNIHDIYFIYTKSSYRCSIIIQKSMGMKITMRSKSTCIIYMYCFGLSSILIEELEGASPSLTNPIVQCLQNRYQCNLESQTFLAKHMQMNVYSHCNRQLPVP